MRRRWLVAQIAFVAMLGVLVFPGEGSAFAGVPIDLTATGPSPAVLTISANTYPIWINTGTVAHTVALTTEGCTVQLAPGDEGSCPIGGSVGTYPYTVDGTVQATVLVIPAWRKVTLSGRRQ